MFELYDIPPHIKPTWQVWHECILPEDRAQAEQVVRDSLAARVPFKLEFRVRVKEGVRHIRSLANRVLNKQGEVERLLGVNMDMTEVKQLNEALFQEKERLQGYSNREFYSGDVRATYKGSRSTLNAGYGYDNQSSRLDYGASGSIVAHSDGITPLNPPGMIL
jgi:outer membrane usher protein FimD/PapC